MIPDLKLKVERQTWQTILSHAFHRVDDLLEYLEINPDVLATENDSKFPIRVPKPFADKMAKGSPQDPLLKQVLPLKEESKLASGFEQDPLKETHANPQPGLLQKFQGRVLLITTQSCSVHCRYCFRRHFPYEANRISRTQWLECFARIAQDASIQEVILSGGDPLNLSDAHLAWFLEQIDAIPHVNTIRLHTRTPIMIPQRITTDLLTILSRLRSQCVFVFHINHPNELCDALRLKLAQLHPVATLLNQSVLLKGINDHASTLIQLSHTLFQAGVLPYYLHQLDKVQGSHHFQVPSEDLRALIQPLYEQLPGYLVPKFVQEQPGLGYKAPMDLSFLTDH